MAVGNKSSVDQKFHLWLFRSGERGVRLEINPNRYMTGLGGLLIGLAFLSLFVVFPVSSWLQPTPQTLEEIENDYGKTLDSQVNFLTGEISRVKKYEEDLKVQSELLDSILEDIGGIDTSPEKPNQQEASVGLFDMALGGATEPLVPVRKHQESVSKLFLGLEKSKSLVDKLSHQVNLLKTLPIGEPALGTLSSDFGMRRSPFTGRWQMHKGIDFASQRKAPVFSTAPGIVKQAGYRAGYGRTVVIEHDNGFETLYGHLSKVLVQVGDEVCRGQEVGRVGSTGRSTGPHLHYEIRHNGQSRNPAPFVKAVEYLELLGQPIKKQLL